MSTLVLGARPPELEQFLQRRRALGQDRLDEVWQGVYHVAPAPHFAHGRVSAELAALLRLAARRAGLVMTDAFNLGEPTDYRVPDQGLHRAGAAGTWLPTAALVVEVVSPDDESYAKFGFYAAHDVDEVLIADPRTRTVRLWQLRGATYEETGGSDLLGLTAEGVAADLEWP